jgi:hypothetical protein
MQRVVSHRDANDPAINKTTDAMNNAQDNPTATDNTRLSVDSQAPIQVVHSFEHAQDHAETNSSQSSLSDEQEVPIESAIYRMDSLAHESSESSSVRASSHNSGRDWGWFEEIHQPPLALPEMAVNVNLRDDPLDTSHGAFVLYWASCVHHVCVCAVLFNAVLFCADIDVLC